MPLFSKKEVWVPSKLGWLVIISGIIGLMLLVCLLINPFLSVNAPLMQGYLIVDGSLSDHAIIRSVNYFDSLGYQKIIVTGGPVPMGSYHSKFQSYAEVGEAKLHRLNFPDTAIVAISVSHVLKDRTYHNALAVKEWLEMKNDPQLFLTIFEVGPHARRSRLLYETVFEDQYHIGVASIPDINFDNQKWWNSSIGFRTVIGESIAYFYVRLFFHP